MITMKLFEGVVPVTMSRINDSKERHNEIRRERVKINNKIKSGNYVEWLRAEHGVMIMDDILTDKEFFNDMIEEIEKSRQRAIVYDKEYLNSYLRKWERYNKRKIILRKIAEKAKLKKSVI